MTLADIPRVAEIHVFAQRTVYRGIMPDEYLFVGNNVVSRTARFTQEMEEDGRVGFVFDNGVIRGFLFLSPCKEEAGTLEMERIFVDPLMLDSGYGRILEEFACKYATENDYSKICLWVLDGNQGARNFYEKTGYAQDGAEKPSQYTTAIKQLRYTKNLIVG